MESHFPTDEASVRHRFDRLCQMSLKGEAINYYKHMDNRRKHEITFSELSDDELRKLKTVDKYFYENEHFTVLGYDVEVKNELFEYSRAAEPPVQCGVSHLSRRTEPHCL